MSANAWDLTFKYNFRWHINPTQIHIFDPSTLPMCWRKNVKVGNILHLLWSCDKITTYWKATFQLLSDITNLTITPSPELALNIGVDIYRLILQPSIVNILLAAKLALVITGDPQITFPWLRWSTWLTPTVHMNLCLLYLKAVCNLHIYKLSLSAFSLHLKGKFTTDMAWIILEWICGN